jgi:hypothetical protein
MKSTKKTNLVTPVCVALWPKLTIPTTKFAKPGTKGSYEVQIVLDPSNEKHAPFIDRVNELYEEAIAEMAMLEKKPKIKRCDPPIRPLTDKEGNETGLFALRAKATAGGTRDDGTDWSFKPRGFTPKGEPYTGQVNHNAKLALAITARPFYVASVGAGLTLALDAYQVYEAGVGGRETATEFGFEVDPEAEAEGEQGEERPF